MVVKRGAVCNTDHQLLLVKRFDVTKLRGPYQNAKGRELLKGKFVSGVLERGVGLRLALFRRSGRS